MRGSLLDSHGGVGCYRVRGFRGWVFFGRFFRGGPWKSRAGMEDFCGGIATGVGEQGGVFPTKKTIELFFLVLRQETGFLSQFMAFLGLKSYFLASDKDNRCFFRAF